MTALRERFRDAARSFGRVFRNPNIRRIEGAWGCSVIAHWSYGIALAVFAYREGGAAAVGLVGLIRFLPSAAASPFAAVLGDRYRRERVLLGGYLSQTLAMGATAAVLLAGAPLPAIYALAALAATSLQLYALERDDFLEAVTVHPQSTKAADAVVRTRLAGR